MCGEMIATACSGEKALPDLERDPSLSQPLLEVDVFAFSTVCHTYLDF